MNFKYYVFSNLFIFLVLLTHSVRSQTENDPVVDEIIESISENVNEDFDYSELAERLSFYRKHPVNIGKINPRQLQELVFLSPIQINSFLLYREESGPIINLLELQTIDNFDLETIKKLLNFISLDISDPFKDISFKNLLNKANNDLIIRYGQILEAQQGFKIADSVDKSKYSGSPQRLLTRYRYNYGDRILATLNMEKDAGEQFFKGTNSLGFDFYSGNVSFNTIRKISKLVIGDYTLQFGQGLSLWSGLSFGKGANITTMAKQEIGLKPYTSVNEALFFRGTAATIQLKNIALTTFISYKKVDASLSETGIITNKEEISSLQISGLHRTPSEIENRNSTTQFMYGSNLQYHKKSLSLGITAYQTKFDNKFKTGDQPYNQFEFAERSLTNLGFNYNYTYKNTYLFGETGHSLNSGFAFINGLMSSITSQVSLVLLYRNYQKNYHSFYNQAIATSSNAVNEKGFYSGLLIKPSSKWELATYADFFEFPWLKFGVDAPSNGYELFSQLSYTPNKKTKVSLRHKLLNRQENDNIINTINTLEKTEKQNYRLEMSYKINKSITLRNRLEMAQFQKETRPFEYGFLAYQDVIYDPLQSKLSGNIRFAIFDTESFDSRIYA
ncbi:MAG: hypothetical protein WBP45_06965, partial [Daejeonella sp.]